MSHNKKLIGNLYRAGELRLTADEISRVKRIGEKMDIEPRKLNGRKHISMNKIMRLLIPIGELYYNIEHPKETSNGNSDK